MSTTKRGEQQECSLYIYNVGPSCAADAIQLPAYNDTWQIGQGWQWPLPSVTKPYPVGGNSNGLVLWDSNKIQGFSRCR